MLENKIIVWGEGKWPIPYSRFIASFNNVGGDIYYDGEFDVWLESLSIPPDDIVEILEMANCGKHELEVNARAFINKYREQHPNGA